MKGYRSAKPRKKKFQKLIPSLDLFVKENQMTKREKEILALLIQQKVSADELGEAQVLVKILFEFTFVILIQS